MACLVCNSKKFDDIGISCRCLCHHLVCLNCAKQNEDRYGKYWYDLFSTAHSAGSNAHLMFHISMPGVKKYIDDIKKQRSEYKDKYLVRGEHSLWLKHKQIHDDPEMVKQTSDTRQLLLNGSVSIPRIGYHEFLTKINIVRETKQPIKLNLTIDGGECITTYSGNENNIELNIFYPMSCIYYNKLILESDRVENASITLSGYELPYHFLDQLRRTDYCYESNDKVFRVQMGQVLIVYSGFFFKDY
jgi:hypothetical protein